MPEGGASPGPQTCYFPPLPTSAAGPNGAILWQANQVCGKNSKSVAWWLELVLQSSLICLSPRILTEVGRLAEPP